MTPEQYPPQEPLSDFGKRYQTFCFERGAGVEGVEDAYGEHPTQRLKVYAAPKPNGTCIVFLHGGGWTNGYKELMALLAPGLNKAGITLVSAGYRLAPEFIFPANLDDLAAAIGQVYRSAQRFKIDPNKIFAGGHSAGAHLTALLALREDWQKTVGVPSDVIKGCLPVSGTFDFTAGCGLSMRPRFLGPEGTHSEVRASPLFNIGARKVPFLLALGSDDFPHLVVQSKKFAQVYAAMGGRAELIELPEGDHITVIGEVAKPDGAWLKRVTGWLNEA